MGLPYAYHAIHPVRLPIERLLTLRCHNEVFVGLVFVYFLSFSLDQYAVDVLLVHTSLFCRSFIHVGIFVVAVRVATIQLFLVSVKLVFDMAPVLLGVRILLST